MLAVRVDDKAIRNLATESDDRAQVESSGVHLELC